MSMKKVVKNVCRDLPDGWLIALHMRRGAALVELHREGKFPTEVIPLPDTEGMSLVEQLKNALRVAEDESFADYNKYLKTPQGKKDREV